jgi:hypothetical protein
VSKICLIWLAALRSVCSMPVEWNATGRMALWQPFACLVMPFSEGGAFESLWEHGYTDGCPDTVKIGALRTQRTTSCTYFCSIMSKNQHLNVSAFAVVAVSRVGAFGIATGRLRYWSSDPGRVKNFTVVRTNSEVHAICFLMGTWRLFPPGIKRQAREADHSPPTSAEVKKRRI